MKGLEAQQASVPRPPVIVITGHIDHGKSTLLDYIRKTNIVDSEAGGITQHLSAYEVVHKKTEDGKTTEQKITFLDTPGHEAFSGMRERGVGVADIAVLIVSAEDGVKAQTLESLKTIKNSGIPYIVAINKIDKPGANIEKAKNELVEHEVYLEGYGGDIPYVLISAKIGTGIPELLDMILLVAELKELTANPEKDGVGIVIESNLDTKRGVTATLIVKDGTVEKGNFIVMEGAVSPIRIIENFLGKAIEKAGPGSPIKLAGLSKAPRVGSIFKTYESKKDAEKEAEEFKPEKQAQAQNISVDENGLTKIVPITLKADTLGTLEAIEKELSKIKVENTYIKIIQKGVGAIGETEVKLALADKENSIILGFNVKIEPKAKDLADREHITFVQFDIIYKLTEWLTEELNKRRPRVKVEETTGKAKILRVFSKERDRQVVGGRVLEGRISVGETVKIMRRDFEIGKGKILELQSQKIKTKEVSEGSEFGLQVDSKMDIAEGDTIESFTVVEK